MAQTITETVNFGPAVPQYDSTLTFNSYTGDLSSLAAVEVTWDLSILNGSLIIDNDGAGAASGSYAFGAHILIDAGNTDVTLLDGSFSPIFANTEVTNNGTFSLGGNSGDGAGDYDPTGPDGLIDNGEAENGSGGGFVNSLFLAQFVSGSGGSAGSTFDIALDTSPFLNITSSGGTEYLVDPVTSFGSVTVTYHLVPEPQTALLLALGAVLACRRRTHMGATQR